MRKWSYVALSAIIDLDHVVSIKSCGYTECKRLRWLIFYLEYTGLQKNPKQVDNVILCASLRKQNGGIL